LHQIYTEYRCDTLVDLGDTLDDRSSIPVPAIDAVCAGLSVFPISKWNIKLVGNHDQYLKSTTLHVGKLFEPYFTVVDRPTVYEYGRINIACAPYPPNEDSLNAFLRSLDKSKPTVLLGHFQLAGCFGHAGQLMTGVSLEMINWTKLCLLGHIHKPQSFGNVHYVGSPFQQNWGEAGENKRVAIVDISEQTGQVSLKWVPLEGYPQYLDVDFETFSSLVTENGEDRYRVNLKSPQEAAAFYAHPLTTHGDPQYDFDVSACTTETDTEIEGDSWTPENVIRRYMERNKPSDKGIALPDAEMEEIGIQLLRP
jgi:DNA repair exonuclease SbcCD nuclease subunit